MTSKLTISLKRSAATTARDVAPSEHYLFSMQTSALFQISSPKQINIQLKSRSHHRAEVKHKPLKRPIKALHFLGLMVQEITPAHLFNAPLQHYYTILSASERKSVRVLLRTTVL